jgi:hypothetical protein
MWRRVGWVAGREISTGNCAPDTCPLKPTNPEKPEKAEKDAELFSEPDNPFLCSTLPQ